MLSDEALYQQLLAGDLGAFDALYQRYERPLFGFVLRQLGGDRQEAEDVLHDAFLALLREREAGRAARSLRAWLFQVARNLCLNRHRSRHRAARALAVVAQAPAAGTEQPEGALERHQTAARLKRAVAKLPPGLAELYQLRAGGMSYEELAEVLAAPVGTVKSRMYELVRRLREELGT
jgi:RNA polymerase sigma-70 factor (ECF subfamily)